MIHRMKSLYTYNKTGYACIFLMEVTCCIVPQDRIFVQGENLALKRAVMKARREIDESCA